MKDSPSDTYCGGVDFGGGGQMASHSPKKKKNDTQEGQLWSYVLYQLTSHHLTDGGKGDLWNAVRLPVMIFQNAAVLEVIHAATGIVPSNTMITLMQVYSRVFVVCGILETTEAAPAGLGLPLSLLAWSVTEIIRYGYYFLNLTGGVPKFLVFLRYTLFIGLYPLGITGELLCMYHAQREIGSIKKWSVAMPNAYNFIFNFQYFIIGYMLLYVPLFPMLYGHMFSQRKKILGGGSDKSNKVKSK